MPIHMSTINLVISYHIIVPKLLISGFRNAVLRKIDVAINENAKPTSHPRPRPRL